MNAICRCECTCATIANFATDKRRWCGCCPASCETCIHGAT